MGFIANNGSLMRLAPVPLASVQHAARMSRTTHGAPEAVDACRYYAGLIVGALQGVEKSALLAPHFTPSGIDWHAAPLAPAIRGTGYVVQALEAALWAFEVPPTFRLPRVT